MNGRVLKIKKKVDGGSLFDPINMEYLNNPIIFFFDLFDGPPITSVHLFDGK